MTTPAAVMELLESQMQRADEIIDCLVLHDDLFQEIVAKIEKESSTANCDASGLNEIGGIPVYTAADNEGVFAEMFNRISTANRIAYSKKTDEGWVIIEVPCADIRKTYGI